jgi:hypothetical protein
MVRLLAINKSPLVRLMMLFAGREKSIVSLGCADAIAWRKEQSVPGQVPPESAVLVTVIVAALAEIATVSIMPKKTKCRSGLPAAVGLINLLSLLRKATNPG